MFERFTDRARRVVVLAQEEARNLNHNYIGTEHILLGLIHEGEGVAAKALESLGISLEAVRQQVEEIVGQGQQAPSGHIPFTARAKRVLELAFSESKLLGHNYIGTEHILLGLIREGEGVAAQVLVRLGADLNRVRQQVIQLLHGVQTPRAELNPVGWLTRVERRLAAIEDRLAAIQDHLGIARPLEASAASGAESGHAETHSDTADAAGADDEPREGEPGGAGQSGEEGQSEEPGAAGVT
jgi:ATP-dependent Clp protease ATP-binding subunit ClpA